MKYFFCSRLFFARLLKSFILNKSPPEPLSKISLGPVGQLDDIHIFKAIASSKTFYNLINR